MDTIYLDNAATSFPKPEGVSDRMKYYLDCVGANVNRSVYTAAQEAGLTTLALRRRLAATPVPRERPLPAKAAVIPFPRAG